MDGSGVPASGVGQRLGGIVDARRGAEFQELNSDSLLNRLNGSHMPFGWTVNPFRGCEMGCRYCYARPTHEYLGHADPVEFEQRIYDFVRREFPWALPGYLELFPRPGSAPLGIREGIERRVEALAREAGFTARSREARVRDEAPARPRQLSLVW